MATEHDILVAARDLISDPARWTTQQYAEDTSGRFVDPDSDQAVCWCGIGAIMKFDGNLDTSEAVNAAGLLGDAAKHLFNRHFLSVNDHSGHTAVLQVFDHAIANAASPATQEG